jgi:O-antigen ligase
MFDLADQYVQTAVDGGLLGLICLIAVIVYGFKYVGRARRVATDKKQALFFWALGSALFGYLMAFFGISLWDQSVLGWYVLLAFIGAAAVPRKAQSTEQPFGSPFVSRIAVANNQPAYVSGSPGRLLDGESIRDDWKVPVHRR